MPITWSWPEEKSPFKTRELIPTKLQARNEDEKWERLNRLSKAQAIKAKF